MPSFPQIHRYYRTSGLTVQQAQKEFADTRAARQAGQMAGQAAGQAVVSAAASSAAGQ